MIGTYARRETADAEMASMLEALAFRAPDGMATWRDPEGAARLGFRWLRTRPGESSPGVATTPGETMALACDGHVFDDEGSQGPLPLLDRFAAGGPDGWRHLDAQFALAIWDRRRRRLTLARDPLGIRFLYYFSSADGAVFASEIKALLAHPSAPRGYDEVALVQYLCFLNAPGPRTLFAGIRRVPAGAAVELTPEGAASDHRYWDLLDAPVDERDDEDYYVARTHELHQASVRRRTVPGPMGALLSGGNDSSANVSLLSRGGAEPLHTFTVGLADFEGDAKYNDLHYARRVAEYAGTRHHEALLSTDEFLATIPETIEAQDDLVSEPSSVFLFRALRLAQAEGLRVVVTGEANDELCCGHAGMVEIRDGHAARWKPLMRLPRLARRAAAALAPLLAPRRHDVLRRAADDGEYFWSYEVAWPETELPGLVPPDLWARCRGELPSTIVARNRRRVDASAHGRRDYLNYVIYAMMQDNYFGNLMLSKLDLLSSRLALEPRCPYTAPAYAHWVYNVPATFKSRDGWVKHFFKKSIEGVLPHDIVYRPKQGFRTPVVELFAGRLGDWARPVLLETGFTRLGILRRDALAALLDQHRRRERDHSNKLWTAMVLNLWYVRWLG
ncbi:MAG TPA: asparagine synthase-related protein [Anaeromyxobacteraceae bacterium]|nr:asparagine synthase-related protein [Anaeromyxobacteraceae bacterium]